MEIPAIHVYLSKQGELLLSFLGRSLDDNIMAAAASPFVVATCPLLCSTTKYNVIGMCYLYTRALGLVIRE